MNRTIFSILAALALTSFFSCTGGQRVIDAGDAGQPTDTSGVDATDTGSTCGAGQHYPEFDHQCTANQGCTNLYASTPACGCTCAVCMDTACMRTLCGTGCADAGADTRTDAAEDAGLLNGDDGGSEDIGSPLGPEYKLVAPSAINAYVWDDYVAWYTEPKHEVRKNIFTGNDICYHRISTKETTCLGVDVKLCDLYDVYLVNDIVMWGYSCGFGPQAGLGGVNYKTLRNRSPLSTFVG